MVRLDNTFTIPKRIESARTLKRITQEVLDELEVNIGEIRTTWDGELLIGQEYKVILRHPFYVDQDYMQVTGERRNKHMKGFCLPGYGRIILKPGRSKEVIPCLGHELGHLLTPNLEDEFKEEIKAFAFQHIWNNAIKSRVDSTFEQDNGYSLEKSEDSIRNNHFFAFHYVQSALDEGVCPRTLYKFASQGYEIIPL